MPGRFAAAYESRRRVSLFESARANIYSVELINRHATTQDALEKSISHVGVGLPEDRRICGVTRADACLARSLLRRVARCASRLTLPPRLRGTKKVKGRASGEFINWKNDLAPQLPGDRYFLIERGRTRRELSWMTYRPIGIIPLRNYGWKLSNHLRAPSSRQVERPGKKRKTHERYTTYGEWARFCTADGSNQREPILPGATRIAAGTRSIRRVNYAVRRRSRRIIYKLTRGRDDWRGSLIGGEDRLEPILCFRREHAAASNRQNLRYTWYLTVHSIATDSRQTQLTNCVNKRCAIRRRTWRDPDFADSLSRVYVRVSTASTMKVVRFTRDLNAFF